MAGYCTSVQPYLHKPHIAFSAIKYYLFIHARNQYYVDNAVSSSGVVATCTLRHLKEYSS